MNKIITFEQSIYSLMNNARRKLCRHKEKPKENERDGVENVGAESDNNTKCTQYKERIYVSISV